MPLIRFRKVRILFLCIWFGLNTQEANSLDLGPLQCRNFWLCLFSRSLGVNTVWKPLNFRDESNSVAEKLHCAPSGLVDLIDEIFVYSPGVLFSAVCFNCNYHARETVALLAD